MICTKRWLNMNFITVSWYIKVQYLKELQQPTVGYKTYQIIHDFLYGITGGIHGCLVPGYDNLVCLLSVSVWHLDVDVLVVGAQFLYHSTLTTDYLRVVLGINSNVQSETSQFLQGFTTFSLVIMRSLFSIGHCIQTHVPDNHVITTAYPKIETSTQWIEIFVFGWRNTNW